MNSVQTQLNAGSIWLVCGVIVAFIAAACVIFMIRAWRAGKALGMDPVRLRRAVTSSATFSILPSIGILLGVLALSGSLGTPWPWLRLSVIGALHYETTVASGAAEMVTGHKLSAETMTTEAFPTVALLMSLCIVVGMILSVFFTKRYLKRLQAKNPAGQDLSKSSGGFGDRAMIAMFIGLVSAYLGSYIGAFVSLKPDGVKEIAEGVTQVNYATARFSFLGDWTPLVAAAAAAAAMAVFLWLKEKKNLGWLENFAIAGSMLVGMLAAVLVSLLKGGQPV
ncbi:MAG: DUF5058 family protein [Clostridia bacterium]|jgi:hypothetical protein|nr:DUF5058 family protein [Clostridia bacterium]